MEQILWIQGEMPLRGCKRPTNRWEHGGTVAIWVNRRPGNIGRDAQKRGNNERNGCRREWPMSPGNMSIGRPIMPMGEGGKRLA